VVATIGSTSSTAVDPVAEIGETCAREGLFLHVDAALAGAAALLPEMRHHFRGVEAADSFVFNPHKWLFTTFDCSAHFVRDPGELQRTFAIDPEYLRTSVDGRVTNYRDWGVALGRRFRALKLWFVLRYHGAEGLRSQLRAHLALARALVGWIEGEPDLELLAPAPFIAACFRVHPPGLDDEEELEGLNRALLARVRARGKVYFTHTRLAGRLALRVAIGQTWTRQEHLEALRSELVAVMEELGVRPPRADGLAR
jgi:aromatic-L-amino-acid decarboxylase